MREPKRVVVWGTGFVGKLVIAEILPHPAFELIGVGVSNPEKVGRDAGEICGLDPIGITATDVVEELIELEPDALVHFGPTANSAHDNIDLMGAFLRAGIDVCSTAMTPWVWPAMEQNPPAWIDPITEACESGGASCFTTGIDPGFANDLFPMTLMGLCGEVRKVRALEILDYINYEGDYENEMGIGRPPEFTPLLEHTDILVMAWGATVPMMAYAVGIELDEITTHVGEVGHRHADHHRQGRHQPGRGGRHPLHHQRRLQRRDPHPARAREPRRQRRRARLAPRHPRRRLPGRDRGLTVDHPGDGVPLHRRRGRDAAAAGCLATGCGPSTRCRPSTTSRPVGSPRSTCHSSPASAPSASGIDLPGRYA